MTEKQVSRREFLRLSRDVVTASTVLALGCTVENTQSPEAEEIRQKISRLEIQNRQTLSPEAVNEIFNLTNELYEKDFGQKPIPTIFKPHTYEEAKRDYGNNLNALKDFEYPRGISPFSVTSEGESLGIILVTLGNPEHQDPNLPQISVVKGILFHEFFHSQTEIKAADGKEIVVGELKITPVIKRGFKLEAAKPVEPQFGNYPVNETPWWFEEINVQLLAMYLNDPTLTDNLWKKINESPVYKDRSLHPKYVAGAEIFFRLYQKLQIPIEQVERFHRASDLFSFLALIDKKAGKPIANELIKHVERLETEDVGNLEKFVDSI